MRRIILSLTILVGLFALFPAPASAAIDPFKDLCAQNPQAEACQGRAEQQVVGNNAIYGANGIITKVTNLLSTAVGVVSVIMISIGGIQYVMSTGDPSKTAKAKSTILFAVVGIVVAIFAKAIVVFVLNKL